MNIPVIDKSTYEVVMNEDGEFHCPHYNTEIEYEQGGDGYTEPAGGWVVYCNDCDNDDLQDHEVESILEGYDPTDPDFEYEQYKDGQL